MKSIVAMALGLVACGGGSAVTTPVDAMVVPDGVVVAPLPDLRFKSVGAFAAYAPESVMGISSGLAISNTGPSEYSGLEVGGGAAWGVVMFRPAVPSSSLRSSAMTGATGSAPSAIGALPPGSVITSIDYAGTAFAMVSELPAVSGPSATTTATGQVTAEADLAAYVTARAAQGLVVTALGFDGTAIDVFAYGIQGDAQTYETSVVQATLDTIPAQAAVLASHGYIITAFGRTSPTTFTLVGTRRTGATAPRELITDSPSITDPYKDGYVLVGLYFKQVADPTTMQFEFAIFER